MIFLSWVHGLCAAFIVDIQRINAGHFYDYSQTKLIVQYKGSKPFNIRCTRDPGKSGGSKSSFLMKLGRIDWPMGLLKNPKFYGCGPTRGWVSPRGPFWPLKCGQIAITSTKMHIFQWIFFAGSLMKWTNFFYENIWLKPFFERFWAKETWKNWSKIANFHQ